MKLISWNVNGLRACCDKGFRESFATLDADFFCLQETKMQEGQLDLSFDGYESYWNYAEKKGYSGTAIFTKHKPISVSYGIGIDEHDHEGRVITLEMDNFYLVTVYTPNSQDGLKRLDYRMTWEEDFRNYLLSLDKNKPVIVCGDLNVAHKEIDLKNPKTNRKNAGFTDEEREKFQILLDNGFVDTFRYFYPEQENIYSWWSYRFKAREKNAGWRIDYFLVSDRLKDKLSDAKIHTEIFGSDHCPVEVTLDC
ncbi:MAG: exodeoxyribonuclease III [Parabacteroides sp.]|nr:exodeoxyribonuclease III [Parabacteroides sp.]